MVNRTLHTFTNTSQLYYKMSALKYIRPIPNIDGTVRDIWAKCEDGRFDYTQGSCLEIDSDDMDV